MGSLAGRIDRPFTCIRPTAATSMDGDPLTPDLYTEHLIDLNFRRYKAYQRSALCENDGMLTPKTEAVVMSTRMGQQELNTPGRTAPVTNKPPAVCQQATLPDHAWAERQWGEVNLGDKRLTQRAVELGARMAAHPQASLPEQAQSHSMLVGGYRLMNNQRVSLEKLLSEVYTMTRAAAEQQALVLLIHDTTELDFTDHEQTRGLGPIGDGRGRGLLLHSMLAVVPATQQVLGLAHSQAVLREATAGKRKEQRRTAEAQLWEVAAHAMGKPPAGSVWVNVSDRGSDGFEYMSACLEEATHFVVRAKANRLLNPSNAAVDKKQEGLLDHVRQLPAQPGSGYDVSVDATPTQAARTAHIVLAWDALTIPPPVKPRRRHATHAPISTWVVRAWEPNPPQGAKPVEWVLITSWPVHTLSDATRIVDWYTCRWLCEDYHQCLKTGCRVEDTQLDDGADIQRLLGFKIPIAVRLLQLRQLVRIAPDQLAQKLIDPLLVKIAAHSQNRDAASMTMNQFWINVAKTGGYQGRRSDGPPGWRTLWAGWCHINDLATGARLFASGVT